MEIEFKTVYGPLSSSHNQKVLLVELVKIYREGSRLELHLSCQLLVLQNLHLVWPTQSNCYQLILRLMGVTCCQTIWSWIFGFTNVKSLNELSCREIIELNDICVGVVAAEQSISVHVKTIAWDRGSTYFSDWTAWNPDIPNLNSRIPASTDENWGVFGHTLNREDAIDMMIHFQFFRPSSLKFIDKLQSFIIKYLQSVPVSPKNTPFLFLLIITAKIRYIVPLVMPIGSLLVWIVPFDGPIAVTGYKIAGGYGFPGQTCCGISA